MIQFSETELSADDASSSPESKEKKLVERKIEKDPKKKKPAFLPKALSATLTFFASGMFHECVSLLDVVVTEDRCRLTGEGHADG